MPTRTRTLRRPASVPDLIGVVREYLLNRSMRERSSHHENQLKAGLMAVLEQTGEEDPETGHRTIVLDTPLPFTSYRGEHGVEKHITAIQRQKRKGTLALNEERAMAFLKRRRKLLAECTTTITVINEDALLAANFEGRITDSDFNALYEEGDPTYAFYILED
jgi:hypothetical protein